MIKHAPVVPPPDDDHDCGWRAHANSLADQVAELKEKLEAMERRVFGRSSEKGKTGKMPPPVKVVRTPEQAKTARQELAALRMAKLQVEVTPVPVPQDQRTCPKCHKGLPA
jgi:Transposase C of IS166 homeodomain